eukprot:7357867-Pyramimonas_sp.AAC.1
MTHGWSIGNASDEGKKLTSIPQCSKRLSSPSSLKAERRGCQIAPDTWEARIVTHCAGTDKSLTRPSNIHGV